ncbi:hypothetical protein KL86PLE_40573 [uncultured Pleomorphomonas sp.]|uniref:Uncharacterized protein n=1 Tax=uncultured Pleomorphomonas sp. TaxID=442121 RepID=A0A212LGZ0_9HYPH|nr:hypothetical protein KL86PLE_40573 [uncultured Pleomorphomonas sp.]
MRTPGRLGGQGEGALKPNDATQRSGSLGDLYLSLAFAGPRSCAFAQDDNLCICFLYIILSSCAKAQDLGPDGAMKSI